VFIPIFTLNTDKRAWGKDAQEFRYAAFNLASPSSPCRGSGLMLIVVQTRALGKRFAWHASPTGSMGQHHELPRWFEGVHRIPLCYA
jgi:hypothetical protein